MSWRRDFEGLPLPLARPLRNKFGAASRQLLALGPGSHSACAPCARESGAKIGTSLSTAFPGRLERSAAKWKAIRDPAQELAAKRRRISPFPEVSLKRERGSRRFASVHVLPEEAERSFPGEVRRRLVVARRGVVVEGVVHARVDS